MVIALTLLFATTTLTLLLVQCNAKKVVKRKAMNTSIDSSDETNDSADGKEKKQMKVLNQ